MIPLFVRFKPGAAGLLCSDEPFLGNLYLCVYEVNSRIIDSSLISIEPFDGCCRVLKSFGLKLEVCVLASSAAALAV